MINTTRFGVRHLLVVTASIALMAAWWQFCDNLQSSGTTDASVRMAPVRKLLWATIQGCLLPSLMFVWRNGQQRSRWLYHPGHWILLLNALPIPFVLVIHTVRSFQIDRYGDNYASWIAYAYPDLIYLAVYLAISLLWMLGVVSVFRQDGIAWATVAILFAAVSLNVVLDFATGAANRPNPFSAFATELRFTVLVAILFATVHDLWARVPRDWLHRFSLVVTFIAFLGTPMIDLFEAMGW